MRGKLAKNDGENTDNFPFLYRENIEEFPFPHRENIGDFPFFPEREKVENFREFP